MRQHEVQTSEKSRPSTTRARTTLIVGAKDSREMPVRGIIDVMPYGKDISFEDASALIVVVGVTGIVKHPACYDFWLKDGRVIALYPGDRDIPDGWVEERAQVATA